jgi:hypothetical protein
MSCGKCGLTSDGRWLENKTANASQDRQLADSELDLVSGGEGPLVGLVKAAIAAGVPIDLLNSFMSTITNSDNGRRASQA